MRYRFPLGAFLFFLPAAAWTAQAAGNDPAPVTAQAPGNDPTPVTAQPAGNDPASSTAPLPVSPADVRPGAAPLPTIPAGLAPDPAHADPAAVSGAASPGPGAASGPSQSGGALLPVQFIDARDDVPQQERLSPATPVTAPGTISITPAGEAATFQGRVAGPGPFTGAQVAAVALKPSPWTDPANFQWTAVRPDGSFSIRAVRNPGLGKTLALSVPGQALTFLHWDFAPDQSARGITIAPSAARHASVTVAGPAGLTGQTVTVEVFEARDYRGPAGQAVARQRLGVFTGSGSGVPVDLPDEPVGLYVSAPGLAAYYQIVDPAKARRFDFRLLREGAITLRVVRGGAPANGVAVLTGCPDAPFSWRRRTTGRDGLIQLTGMPPGEYQITADGGRTSARIRSGETATAVLTLNAGDSAREPASADEIPAHG